MTETIDLVGGQFAVIESDPGVFTTLTHKLGMKTLSFVEVYDTASHAMDHLNPRGLIFCYLWQKESPEPANQSSEIDEDAENVWFANQLIDDGCATQAILNIVLNCEGVQIGETLEQFKAHTDKMSPVMKGLAISNSRDIREAHNSLARPSDVRGALYAAAKATDLAAKTLKAKAKPRTDIHASKKRKVTSAKPKTEPTDTIDAYHFIGYVPAHGRVWELDGLKNGPLDVGVFEQGETWMDVVRPALRMKMQKFGGDGTGDIRFSLLALVDDPYCRASDQLELEKRRRLKIENRLKNEVQGWESLVDQNLLMLSRTILNVPVDFFAKDLGHRRQISDIEVLDMPVRRLPAAWNECIQKLSQASFPIEDELKSAEHAHTDQIKRTFDYAPFLREFVKELHLAGTLNEAAGRDSKGKKLKVPQSTANKDLNGDGKVTKVPTQSPVDTFMLSTATFSDHSSLT